MELVDKIRFVMGSLEKMAVHTSPFVCQILGTDDGKSGELVGSGFRCRFAGQQFVVSACHVVPGHRSDSGGDATPEGGPYFNKLVASIGTAERPLILSDVCHDPLADLSVSRLSDTSIVPGAVDFWAEDRIDYSLDRLSTDYLFVHGFPLTRSKSIDLPIDSRVVSKSLPYGVMQRVDNLPGDLEGFQFAMDFEPANVESEHGRPEAALFEDHPGPRGLSGSPVWRIGVSGKRAIDWSPEFCQLVGIVTQWRPQEKLLVATKSTKLLELVRSIPARSGREGCR